MRTLDNLLYSRALDNTESKLEQATDLASWTKETRDLRIEEINQSIAVVADEAVNVVETMIRSMEDGKSILYRMVLRELIGVKYEVLLGFLEMMNATEDDKLKEMPFDYEWLTTEMRKVNQQAYELEEEITALQDNPGKVEEL